MLALPFILRPGPMPAAPGPLLTPCMQSPLMWSQVCPMCYAQHLYQITESAIDLMCWVHTMHI